MLSGERYTKYYVVEAYTLVYARGCLKDGFTVRLKEKKVVGSATNEFRTQ